MGFLELIGFVSAHTGNDLYDHGMEFFDWVILVLLVIGLIFLVRWFIKRKRRQTRKRKS
jgi:membrane protein DedA with SNARE-associated domain